MIGFARAAILALLLAISGCAVSPAARSVGYQTSNVDVSITRIVHGSVIVGMRGTRLLVDPWFYPRWIFRQSEPLGFLPDALPPLDAIVITRDGMAALDTTALRALAARVPVAIVPAGAETVLREFGFTTVTGLSAGASTVIGAVIVNAIAAGGYVLAHDATHVYLASDPDDMARVTADVERFVPLTVALLPIGGPRLLGFRQGIDPERAADWAVPLAATRTIPYRYGLAGGEPLYSYANDPADRFRRATRGRLSADRIVILNTGDGWHHNR